MDFVARRIRRGARDSRFDRARRDIGGGGGRVDRGSGYDNRTCREDRLTSFEARRKDGLGRAPSGRHPIRESAILGRYILRNWLLPGRKSMVPYSIQWLMRLKPARSRHDLLTLFDLLQHKKIKPLSHNGCLSAKRGTHTNYWEAEA